MKITIPPAAIEAGARHIYQNWHRDSADLLPPWGLLAAEYRTRWLDQARAAFNAMVEAWPGRDAGIREQLEIRNGVLVLEDQGYIILPLTQEASDD